MVRELNHVNWIQWITYATTVVLRNKVIREIRKAKLSYTSKKIRKLQESNPGKWHKEVRNLANMKRPDPTIHVSGINANDHVAIANAINMHLASFSNSQEPLDLRELPSYLPSQEPPPLVHTWEIYNDLRKLSASKAGGPAGIPQSCWINLHMSLVVLWLM